MCLRVCAFATSIRHAAMVTSARPYELWIEEMIRRAGSVEVEHVDDGSGPGMFDALIRYPDRRDAALEITTIAQPSALEAAAFATSLAESKTTSGT